MKTATIVYNRNGIQSSMPVEAADEQTIYAAVNQWRLNEQRLKKDKIEIISIDIQPTE